MLFAAEDIPYSQFLILLIGGGASTGILSIFLKNNFSQLREWKNLLAIAEERINKLDEEKSELSKENKELSKLLHEANLTIARSNYDIETREARIKYLESRVKNLEEKLSNDKA